MARKKKRWLIAVAVVVVAVAAAAFASRTRGNGSGEQEEGPDIPTLAAHIDDVQVIVREVGTVEPEVKVEIKSNLSGRVVDLPVRAGDRVSKGQLIARIEPDVNQAQNLLSVRNRGESTAIDLEDAKQDYEAKRKLFENGLVSEEVNRQAIEMGFTYLLGPILVALRPRLLTVEHLDDLRRYAENLWQDALRLEKLWRRGQLDDVVQIGEEEKQLALSQPWQGSPALMVSDGLFSFGADLLDEAF